MMMTLLCACAAMSSPRGLPSALAGPPDAPLRFLADLLGEGAGPGEMIDHVFLCRLSLVISDNATVADINAALARVDGTIVSAEHQSVFLRIRVPCAGSVAEARAVSAQLDEAPGIFLSAPTEVSVPR